MAEKPSTTPDTSEGLIATLEKLTAAGTQQNEKAQETEADKGKEGDKPAEAATDKGAASDGVGDKPAEKSTEQSGNNDGDAPPKGLSEKGKVDWKALRKKADDFEAKAKALEADLAAARNAATPPEEIEALKTRVKEYEDRLIVTNLEQHPDFQRYFDGQTKALLETAKGIGGEKIAAILTLPEGEYRKAALKEAFVEMDDVDKARLGAVLNDFSKLSAQRTAELAKAREGLTALQQREQAQAKARRDAENRVLEDTMERWAGKDGNPLFQHREGDKEWNDAVDARKAQARRIYSGGLEVKDTAKAALWAVAGPALAAHAGNQEKVIAELRAENAQLKAAKPRLDGGGAQAGGSVADSKLSYAEAVIQGWEGTR